MVPVSIRSSCAMHRSKVVFPVPLLPRTQMTTRVNNALNKQALSYFDVSLC